MSTAKRPMNDTEFLAKKQVITTVNCGNHVFGRLIIICMTSLTTHMVKPYHGYCFKTMVK